MPFIGTVRNISGGRLEKGRSMSYPLKRAGRATPPQSLQGLAALLPVMPATAMSTH